MYSNKLMVALALAATLTFGAGLASADSTTYSLDAPNSTVSGSGAPGPYGTVTVTLTDSTHATIEYKATPAAGWTYAFLDGGSMDAQIHASSFTVSTPTTTQLFGTASFDPPGSGNVDGIGSYNLVWKNHDGWANSFTEGKFTVTNTSGTWANSGSVLEANNKGYFAGVHIGVDHTTTPSTGDNVNLTGFVGASHVTVVPEPASIVIALTGVAGLGLARIRRLRRQAV